MGINKERLNMESSVDLKRLMIEYAEAIYAVTGGKNNEKEFTKVIAAFYRAGIQKGIQIARHPEEYLD